MKTYLEFDCYSSQHIFWVMVLSVPSLILWVIGIPLFAFFVLLINRSNLDSGPVKRIFFILYQGLKQNAFYWEFVNTLRKVLLLLFSTILSVFPPNYSAFISIAILILLIHIQIKIDPYEDQRHNQIEIKAVIAGTVTLFCGILFDQNNQEEGSPLIITLIMAFLIIINLMFIFEWLYLFIKTFNIKNAKVQIILQILASLLLAKHEFDQIIESNSSQKTEQDDKISEDVHVEKDSDDAKDMKHHSHLYDKLSNNCMNLYPTLT